MRLGCLLRAFEQKGQCLQLETCKGEWWTGYILKNTDGEDVRVSGRSSTLPRGTFPSTFVARGRAVPAQPPPKATAMPSIPSALRDGVALEPDSTGVEEGVPPSISPTVTDDVLAARFARFDTNQDGVLGTEEVSVLMTEMGFAADDDYITALITKFDKNADGVLECHEFGPLFEFLRAAQGLSS